MIGFAALSVAALPYAGEWSAQIDAWSALLPLAIPLAVLSLILSFRCRSFAVIVPSLLALVLTGTRMAPEWAAERPPPLPGGERVRIVTHNIHHGGEDPARLTRMLAQSGADILLLQENDAHSAAVLRSLSRLYSYRDGCGACEIAILSRWPIATGVHYRLPGSSGQVVGPPLYRANIRLPSGTLLTVATLHAPHPSPVGPQAAFFAALIEGVRHQRMRHFILTGDFNQTPWSASMHDLDQAMRPMVRVSRANFSYPAKMPILPIDHIFVSPDIGVDSVATMAGTGSDHRAISAQVVVREESP